MKEEFEDKKELITTDATANAVQVIKAAILHHRELYWRQLRSTVPC